MKLENLQKAWRLRIGIPILLMGGLGACKSPQPNVYLQAGDLAQDAQCPAPAAQDFQGALRTLDFAAASRLANPAEQELLRRAEGFALGGQIPTESSPTAIPAGADSLLRQQFGHLQVARAWLRDDFARVVQLAQARDGLIVDPSTAGLSAAFAQDPRKQRLQFRQETFTVPLQQNNTGNPLIDVYINGKPYRFWLDTGAGVTVVSSAVAAKVGLRPASAQSGDLNTSTKHVVQASPGYIDSLRFGGLEVYDHPCVILDKQDLIVRFLGIPLVKVDGIIGWPLLRALDLEFDLPGQQLTVRKPAVRAVSRRDLGWFWQPFVRVHTASGCRLNLMLDTGSTTTFFHPAAYAKLGLQPSKSGKTMRGGAGGTEVVPYDQLDTCRFTVGQERMVMDYAEGIAAQPEGDGIFEFDGVLGQDILAKGKFRLDFRNRSYEFEWTQPAAR